MMDPSRMRPFLRKASLIGLDSREDLKRAMQRLTALKGQGKVSAAAAELIADDVKLSVEARGTVLTGSDDEIAELGRDLLRLRQLQDMLDGNGREPKNILCSPQRASSRRLASPGRANLEASPEACTAGGSGGPASNSRSTHTVQSSTSGALEHGKPTTQASPKAKPLGAPDSAFTWATASPLRPSPNGANRGASQGGNAEGGKGAVGTASSTDAQQQGKAKAAAAPRLTTVAQTMQRISPFPRTLLGFQPARCRGGPQGIASPPPPPDSPDLTQDPLALRSPSQPAHLASTPFSTPLDAKSSSPASLLTPSPSPWSFLSPGIKPATAANENGYEATELCMQMQSNPIGQPSKTTPVIFPRTVTEEQGKEGEKRDMTWLSKRAPTSAAHFRPIDITSPGRRARTQQHALELEGRKELQQARPTLRAAETRSAENCNLRGILKHKSSTSASGKAGDKKVTSFGSISMRFFNYTIGESVPSDKGPCLGLAWAHEVHGTIQCSIDEFETFRGVVWDASEFDENEMWNVNWRTPCKYFTEDRHLPIQKRVELLLTNGHRRPSIDLNMYEVKSILAARQASGRSRAGYMVLKGGDPEKAMEIEARTQAMRVVMTWLSRLVRQRRRIRERTATQGATTRGRGGSISA